jgi:hypothetical protein
MFPWPAWKEDSPVSFFFSFCSILANHNLIASQEVVAHSLLILLVLFIDSRQQQEDHCRSLLPTSDRHQRFVQHPHTVTLVPQVHNCHYIGDAATDKSPNHFLASPLRSLTSKSVVKYSYSGYSDAPALLINR